MLQKTLWEGFPELMELSNHTRPTLTDKKLVGVELGNLTGGCVCILCSSCKQRVRNVRA